VVRKPTLLRTHTQQEGFPRQSSTGAELFAKTDLGFGSRASRVFSLPFAPFLLL